MAAVQTIEETREAILEQLSAVRMDLERHRGQVLRQASAVWFDLAIAYARDTRPEAACVRRDGAQRTVAELDAALNRCTLEEIRLGEMLAEFDLRIALFAQGQLPSDAPPSGPSPVSSTGARLRAAFSQVRERLARYGRRTSRAPGGHPAFGARLRAAYVRAAASQP
jgi:hypothetical protein